MTDPLAVWALPPEEVIARLDRAAVGLELGVAHWPPLQRLFGTEALDMAGWGLCVGVASTVFVDNELRKLVARPSRTLLRRQPA